MCLLVTFFSKIIFFPSFFLEEFVFILPFRKIIMDIFPSNEPRQKRSSANLRQVEYLARGDLQLKIYKPS